MVVEPVHQAVVEAQEGTGLELLARLAKARLRDTLNQRLATGDLEEPIQFVLIGPLAQVQ